MRESLRGEVFESAKYQGPRARFFCVCRDKVCLVPDVQILSPFIIAIIAERNDVPVLVSRAVLLDLPAKRGPVDAALREAHIGVLAAEYFPVSKPVAAVAFDLRCSTKVSHPHVFLLWQHLALAKPRIPQVFFEGKATSAPSPDCQLAIEFEALQCGSALIVRILCLGMQSIRSRIINLRNSMPSGSTGWWGGDM